MIPGAIRGANCAMMPPDNMDDCVPLLVLRGVQADGAAVVQSAWYPTADELRALNDGGSVILTIYGEGMPPVSLGVAE